MQLNLIANLNFFFRSFFHFAKDEYFSVLFLLENMDYLSLLCVWKVCCDKRCVTDQNENGKKSSRMNMITFLFKPIQLIHFTKKKEKYNEFMSKIIFVYTSASKRRFYDSKFCQSCGKIKAATERFHSFHEMEYNSVYLYDNLSTQFLKSVSCWDFFFF